MEPMNSISEGPEYDAWVQRWKDASVLVETDELAALKEGKALIKTAANFDYKEVLPLLKPFTKVLMEHKLMVEFDENNNPTPPVEHDRTGCEICELMLDKPGNNGCGGDCTCGDQNC
jgi:hypothetical protein